MKKRQDMKQRQAPGSSRSYWLMAPLLIWLVSGVATLPGRLDAEEPPGTGQDGAAPPRRYFQPEPLPPIDALPHVRRYRHPSIRVHSIDFSPDGRQFVFGGSDADAHTQGSWKGSVWVFDRGGRRRHRLKGHQEWIECVRFSPDGRQVLSSSLDGTIRLWDLTRGRLVKTFSDGKTVSDPSGSPSTPITSWVKTLSQEKTITTSLVFSADGKRVLSSDVDGTVRVWELSTGREVRRIDGLEPGRRQSAFVANETQIATTGRDNLLRVFDAATGAELRRYPIVEGTEAVDATFSADGRRMLVVTYYPTQGVVVVLDVMDGHEIARFGKFEQVGGIALSPDGRRAMFSVGDRAQWNRLWDVDSGRELARIHIRGLMGHEQAVALAFSPDGRTLLSGVINGFVDLWRLPPVEPAKQERKH